MNPDDPKGTCSDRLLELKLRVARRADEIARARRIEQPLNLHCWLLAETEVLAGEMTDRPSQLDAVGRSS
jgi:hypothetical protein